MQVKKFVCAGLLACLAGCASLPTSGPTRGQIEKTAIGKDAPMPIEIVEVVNTENLPAAIPAANLASLLPERTPPPTDMIGPGDILDVTIFEAGVSLFSGGGVSGSDPRANQIAVKTGVQSEKLPPSRVNDSGDIVVPYAGKLHVGGRTVGEVEAMIRRSLHGLSQNPQVTVTRSEIITNSVIVGGEVAKPGRLVLQTNRESLSDVIALAGGYRGSVKDLTLRVTRRNESVSLRLGELVDTPAMDVRAYPGDRLMLISEPRSFSVLGASGRVDQLPFSRASISLAEAIATAGGANPNFGDAAAIFVFRYVTDEQGNQKPVVYHLNMMKSGAYFLSQHFAMRDKDVLYFGNAAANQPSKLFALIGQLFTPLTTITGAAQTISYTSR